MSKSTPDTGNPIRVAILGSTGSIGTQTLDVIGRLGGRFKVVALAAGRDLDALLAQAAALPEPPALLALADEEAARSAPAGIRVLGGEAGMVEATSHPDADIVVVATTGHAGFAPTLAALEAGKEVALANKEALVMAGEVVTGLARRKGIRIRPIDSEHSALWQCLVGEPEDPSRDAERGASGAWSVIEKVVLTASGGPFRTWSAEDTYNATPRQALKHPTWSMGAKVTIDSATMMNKGLEVIEAHWLFGMPFDDIEVVIHPESIIHSMVRFVDGSAKAQLGIPDMRVPIQYALTYPDRYRNPAHPRADWPAVGTLHFEAVDTERFRCLSLAFQAGRMGATYPTAMAAADEAAVPAFLAGLIRFGDIPGIIEDVLEKHVAVAVRSPDIAAIKWADAWARNAADELIAARRP
ncbi:MAG TPA: 1-deoxy-D-xylulose-5-phosphate reductoisomerase [Chloroflexia bacterium]|nr:1-deoxy-D-xylulose-5-phosphate reductoisomerase [Chloroflexia bacterium]